MIEGVRLKIEELKSTWDDLSLDRQVELGKIVLDLKKVHYHSLFIPPLLLSFSPSFLSLLPPLLSLIILIGHRRILFRQLAARGTRLAILPPLLLPLLPLVSQRIANRGITKTIFSTLDKIHELCVGMVTNVKQRSLRHSDNAVDEGLFTEKLLEIFKTLSTK